MKLLKLFLSLLAVISISAANSQETKGSFVSHTVLENDKLKVTEFVSQPGADVCGKGNHTHVPHLTVLLTDAEVEITTADGKKVKQKVPAGTSFWSEAETHAVINIAKEPLRIQIIELKK